MKSKKLLEKLFNKKNLSFSESCKLFESLLLGKYSNVEMAAILTSLKIKGESIDEIAGAIMTLDKFKVKIKKKKSPALDTCGTGGDRKNCMNVSTAVAILLSAMDIPVVKHGNSAQSGKIGSADILREFGIPYKMQGDDAEKFFDENNFVFLFAPLYHPAMKYVMPIRKTLQTSTIFNYIGPFVNPANPDFQFTGINTRKSMEKIANALVKAKKFNILLYSSFDGYDEFSTFAPTECIEIRENFIKKFIVNPEDFFKPFLMPQVTSIHESKTMFLEAVKGENENLSKLLALNAALGIKYIKKTKTLKKAYKEALDAITSGSVYDKFQTLQNHGGENDYN